jgi:hypothetical protein
MSFINQAAQRTEQLYSQAQQSLAADIAAARADVESQYKLARTRSERKALRRQLRDLKNQEQAAGKAIDRAYDEATGQVQKTAAANERNAQAVADRTYEFWDRATKAQDANTATAAQTSEAGEALGLGEMAIGGDVTGESAFTARRGAADAAMRLDLGRVAAAEQRALAASLAGQEAARQGEMQRAVLGLRADTVADSYAASDARIAQERAARAAALQNLAAMGMQGRQQNLSDLAGLTMDTGTMRSQLQNDWANAVAQAQAQDAQNRYEARLAGLAGGVEDLTPEQFARRQARFIANSPLMAPVNALRATSGEYKDQALDTQPVTNRELAALVEGLIGSSYGLPDFERRQQAAKWVAELKGTFGNGVMGHLASMGITEQTLGL